MLKFNRIAAKNKIILSIERRGALPKHIVINEQIYSDEQ
jgi:hypothetical protein